MPTNSTIGMHEVAIIVPPASPVVVSRHTQSDYLDACCCAESACIEAAADTDSELNRMPFCCNAELQTYTCLPDNGLSTGIGNIVQMKFVGPWLQGLCRVEGVCNAGKGEAR